MTVKAQRDEVIKIATNNNTDEFEKGLDLAEESLSREGPHKDLDLRIAQLYMLRRVGRHRRAEELVEQYLGVFPSEPGLLLERAMNAFNQKRYDQAISQFTKLLDNTELTEGQRKKAYIFKASAQERIAVPSENSDEVKPDYKPAIQTLKEARSHFSKDAQVAYELGRLHYNADIYDEAQNLLDQAFNDYWRHQDEKSDAVTSADLLLKCYLYNPKLSPVERCKFSKPIFEKCASLPLDLIGSLVNSYATIVYSSAYDAASGRRYKESLGLLGQYGKSIKGHTHDREFDLKYLEIDNMRQVGDYGDAEKKCKKLIAELEDKDASSKGETVGIVAQQRIHWIEWQLGSIYYDRYRSTHQTQGNNDDYETQENELRLSVDYYEKASKGAGEDLFEDILFLHQAKVSLAIVLVERICEELSDLEQCPCNHFRQDIQIKDIFFKKDLFENRRKLWQVLKEERENLQKRLEDPKKFCEGALAYLCCYLDESMESGSEHENKPGKSSELITSAKELKSLSLGYHGKIAEIKGNFTDAERLYQRSIQTDSKIGARTDLGRLYVKWKRNLKAQDTLKKALEENNNDVMALVWMAILSTRHNDYPSAIQYLEQAKSLDPKNADVSRQLVCLLVKSNDLRKAKKQLEDDLRLMPYEYEAHIYLDLSALMTTLGSQEASTTYFHEAQKYNEEAKRLLVAKGLLRMTEPDKCLHARSHYQTAIVHLYLKKYELALESFKTALDLNPLCVEAELPLRTLERELSPLSNRLSDTPSSWRYFLCLVCSLLGIVLTSLIIRALSSQMTLKVPVSTLALPPLLFVLAFLALLLPSLSNIELPGLKASLKEQIKESHFDFDPRLLDPNSVFQLSNSGPSDFLAHISWRISPNASVEMSSEPPVSSDVEGDIFRDEKSNKV